VSARLGTRHVAPELKDGQRAANRQFAAIGWHMAGFHRMVATQQEEIVAHNTRVERADRRLDLVEPD
jgi:hypothetical protein